MAERKRRGGEPAEERRGGDEVVDDAALVEGDSMSEDETAAEDEAMSADDGSADSESATSKAAGAGKAKKDKAVKAKVKGEERTGIFSRFANFIREIVGELRKVIWPTRNELLTYTTVVVVFVVMMFTIIGFLDYGFAKGVLWVFGHDAE